MDLLNKLPSPIGLTHNEIMNILFTEEYGYLPSKPTSFEAEPFKKEEPKFCAGKAVFKSLKFTVKAEWGEFSFPLYYVCPKKNAPVPAFIHINFRDDIPDRYQPTEEIIDAGYATLTFCYKDVSSDDGDFTSGLAGVVYKNGRPFGACGKIGLWAYAACAVLEYALTLPELDGTKISVAGHSRLGKTALLAGALDERFYCAFSNDSGCGGASLARENTGEDIKAIVTRFPYWFCEKYQSYAENEDSLPFDQHYLLAANSAHKVYVASAAEDAWACPQNEYLSCIAASEYFEKNGKVGFVHHDRLPNVGECFHKGNIGYHLREGTHFMSREDWKYYINFLNGVSAVQYESVKPYPRICAHRGFNTVAPENTLPAFGAAVALGADEIEFDIWSTSDGVLVSCHDSTLDRVSDGEGNIYEKTYAELLKLDFGCKAGEKFKGLKITTFEEILQKFAGRVIMNIHVKIWDKNFPDDKMEEIIGLVRKYDCARHVYFMTRSDRMIKKVMEYAPDIKCCVGWNKNKTDFMEIVNRAVALGAYKIQLFKPYFDEETVKAAHANGILCNVFWADDPEEARLYRKWGIDTILTNDYLSIKNALEAK